MNKPLALDLSFEEWQTWAEEHNLPRFLAKQIFHWIYQEASSDPQHWTNLSKEARDLLAQSYNWAPFEIDCRLKSEDQSEKFLLKTQDGLWTEMVLMPYSNRATLCLSSQVGCRMGCTFCQTGKMGFRRNLSAGEILMQILMANQALAERGTKERITNVVFMGMGEPLDNYEAVVQACKMMIDEKGFGLAKSRVTVSTSGLVPEIVRLGKELPVRLAISLHNADNTKRSAIMPVNRRYPLEMLKKALVDYPAPHRFGITFEYVMIEGQNDGLEDAKKLVHFLHGIKAKVNLIPLNHFPGIPMEASSAEKIRAFQSYLSDRSIPCPVRYSRGQDVSGGCGQLAAKKEEELHMDPRTLARQRRMQK